MNWVKEAVTGTSTANRETRADRTAKSTLTVLLSARRAMLVVLFCVRYALEPLATAIQVPLQNYEALATVFNEPHGLQNQER